MMTNPKFAGCTIIAKNEISMAAVLAQSWHTYHPDSPFFALLLDGSAGFSAHFEKYLRVVRLTDLQIPNLRGFLFRFTQRDASLAIKPFFFLHLLREYSFEAIVYVAPESLIFRSLAGLAPLLNEADIILTVHRTAQGSALRSAADRLQSELYAPGLLAFRNSTICRRMIEWWARAASDVSSGDSGAAPRAERWIESVSQMFERVYLLYEPEYDTGLWNLRSRRISMDSSGLGLFVNDEPAYVFNFSGFDFNGRTEGPALQGLLPMNDLEDIIRLLSLYYDLLMQAGWRETSRWTYAYDFFDSGPRIPTSARSYYRSLGIYANELGDPFTWTNDSFAHQNNKTANAETTNRLPFGVNVIGHLRSEKGLGEMVRSNLRVLMAGGIPVVANDFVDLGSENVEEYTTAISGDNPYRANLVTVNADTLPYFVKEHPYYMCNRLNIGYWAWELSDFPSEWATSFGYLDEVWTVSSFARNSIAPHTRVPVRVVHCALDPENPRAPDLTRASFEIPERSFVFLFIFDFHSFMERKNPLGLIRAFKAAFDARKDVRLVIKCSHGQQHLSEANALMKAASVDNIQVLDAVYPRFVKNNLINLVDCYVSLHRSEGFGLTLAESMSYGKPVIATGYSGNMDFMSVENSFLIPYRLMTIDQDHGPYRSTARWADPDLDYAVDVLRYVEKNREVAAEFGRRGQDHISVLLHPETIGKSVVARFQELGLA